MQENDACHKTATQRRMLLLEILWVRGATRLSLLSFAPRSECGG